MVYISPHRTHHDRFYTVACWQVQQCKLRYIQICVLVYATNHAISFLAIAKSSNNKLSDVVLINLGAITDEPLGNSSKHGVLYTKSFPCPRGYYCESGDTTPRPCPNATYNPDERGSRRENCLPCGVDHYNHLTGQSACFHCGGQARQPYLGQDKCQCNGLHRVFMVNMM